MEARHLTDKTLYNQIKHYKVHFINKLPYLQESNSLNEPSESTNQDTKWFLSFDAFQGLSDKSEHTTSKDMAAYLLTAIKGITLLKSTVLLDRFNSIAQYFLLI